MRRSNKQTSCYLFLLLLTFYFFVPLKFQCLQEENLPFGFVLALDALKATGHVFPANQGLHIGLASVKNFFFDAPARREQIHL